MVRGGCYLPPVLQFRELVPKPGLKATNAGFGRMGSRNARSTNGILPPSTPWGPEGPPKSQEGFWMVCGGGSPIMDDWVPGPRAVNRSSMKGELDPRLWVHLWWLLAT